MRTPQGIIITFLIIILVDFYLFFVIRSMTNNISQKARLAILAGFWLISVLTVIGLLLFIFTNPDFLGRRIRLYLFAILVSVFLSQLLATIFFLIDDIRRGVQWVAIKLFYKPAGAGAGAISRSDFLNWLGAGAGSLLLGSMLYGFSNKYKYKLKRIKLHFDNLPDGFKGMKMIQFSDVHSGSFDNKKAVMRGVNMIMEEKADLIIFSGDMVNDMAIEMKDYMDVFNQVKAPLGVYSTLGNHDYGDYMRWPVNGLTKAQNLEDVKKIHADLGWNLLNNRHVIIERNGDKLPVIGVENWSNVGRFPKYGDLHKAYAGTEDYPFKLLISHDPSHWDAQIRPEFPDIDLTLSGHTHGMQFGVKIPGFQWSPIQYAYKEWDGMYESGSQKLYVNPGYGFIGYPGRVGIMPEITVFEFV